MIDKEIVLGCLGMHVYIHMKRNQQQTCAHIYAIHMLIYIYRCMWYGEVLYFFQLHVDDGSSRTFAVVSWMLEEIDHTTAGHYLDPDTMFKFYRTTNFPANEEEAEIIPSCVVPVISFKCKAHIVHDCLPSGALHQCIRGGQIIHGSNHNRWYRPA